MMAESEAATGVAAFCLYRIEKTIDNHCGGGGVELFITIENK
jgi:hypothetical protein